MNEIPGFTPNMMEAYAIAMDDDTPLREAAQVAVGLLNILDTTKVALGDFEALEGAYNSLSALVEFAVSQNEMVAD